jgi:hypothetical protein
MALSASVKISHRDFDATICVDLATCTIKIGEIVISPRPARPIHRVPLVPNSRALPLVSREHRLGLVCWRKSEQPIDQRSPAVGPVRQALPFRRERREQCGPASGSCQHRSSDDDRDTLRQVSSMVEAEPEIMLVLSPGSWNRIANAGDKIPVCSLESPRSSGPAFLYAK